MMPGPGTPETPPGPPGRPVPGNRTGGGTPAPAATVAAPSAKEADGKKKESDLSVNKVVAGAGAAIVTAILGSFLGAIGTVLGAALGSIITTVATTFFQRSMEHTKAQVVDRTQRIRERTTTRSTRAPGAAAWQAAAAQGGVGRAGPDSQETVRIDAAEVGASPSGNRRTFRMSRRSIVFSLVAGVLAFGVAMFLVTGIELVKGSTITGGGSGTSIGNVANGTDTRQQQRDDQNTNGTSTSESTTPTGSSSSTSDPSQSSGNDDGSTSSPSTSNPLGGLNKLLPSQGGESGKLQSGQNGSNNTGGGADPTN